MRKIFLPVVVLLSLSATKTKAQNPVSQEVRPYLLAIIVQHADTSADWYSQRFGFEQVDAVDIEETKLHIRVLEKEGFRLELIQNATSVHPDSALKLVPQYQGFFGYYKLAFAVDDLDKMDAHFRTLGTRYLFAMSKAEDKDYAFFIVYDPDGNLVQVVEDK